ncbi:1456_t:CDS:2 [Entrophospora sp. SA101]|nr:1456_t:CDS:2 [Entrophospora sp. SA101]CAJ0838307.1 1985_t:CDS:2 [Entrophospora sp. SA101]CAJ0838576.1 12019_t:CDS:2 [Entrophospora sp. SA101]CAJ0892434.1 8225_t:CDS:2 [Entrophospora sp. SA101]
MLSEYDRVFYLTTYIFGVASMVFYHNAMILILRIRKRPINISDIEGSFSTLQEGIRLTLQFVYYVLPPFVDLYVGLDFLIDVYVSVRLFRIMGSANKTLSSTINDCKSTSTSVNHVKHKKSNLTIYSAVLYWNLSRIFIATLLNVNTVIDAFRLFDLDSVFNYSLNFVICIAMSYLITYDKDFVRYIAGKNTLVAN